nr:hypothetical protein CTI12_AA345250 [Tanacetum cinerariifolium]
MKFCIGLEYLNFRTTCKSCHLAAPVLQWTSEAALKRLQNYSLLSPWLMAVDKKRDTVTFEDPLYDQGLYALCDDGELYVLAQDDFSWKQDVVEALRSCCRYPVEYFLSKCDRSTSFTCLCGPFWRIY